MSTYISTISETSPQGVDIPYSSANGVPSSTVERVARRSARRRTNSGELSAVFDEAVRSHADEPFLLSPKAVRNEDIDSSTIDTSQFSPVRPRGLSAGSWQGGSSPTTGATGTRYTPGAAQYAPVAAANYGRAAEPDEDSWLVGSPGASGAMNLDMSPVKSGGSGTYQGIASYPGGATSSASSMMQSPFRGGGGSFGSSNPGASASKIPRPSNDIPFSSRGPASPGVSSASHSERASVEARYRDSPSRIPRVPANYGTPQQAPPPPAVAAVEALEPSNSGKLSWGWRSSKSSPKSSARSSNKSGGASWGPGDNSASTAQSRLRPADAAVEPGMEEDEFAMAEAAAEADAARAALKADVAQGIGRNRVVVSGPPEVQKAPAKGCCCMM